MKNILIIHQSAEMYGSDKTLLLFLSNLDLTKYNPVVILPNEGPLYQEIQKLKLPLYTAPVIKLYRDIFKPLNFLKFIFEIFKALFFIKKLDSQFKFDYIYSNTIAVLSGFLYASLFRKKHIWHVHEIIEKPTLIKNIFKFLLDRKTNYRIVFNSLQTQGFWSKEKKHIQSNGICIWNGLDLDRIPNVATEKKYQIKTELFQFNQSNLILGLVGRISSWKGHNLLLESFKILIKEDPNLKLIFVGSYPPNQEYFLSDLQNSIKESNLENDVHIVPFQSNIWEIWEAIDIAVVPSTEPEPFGMVAIEAMYAKKPVVAAKHGGLLEIVEENSSGLLFKPNDVFNLAEKLRTLTKNSELRIQLGEKGKEIVKEKFSISNHMNQFYKILN
jgi:glycosyltransferase involved in cell wall biosynthesis